MPPKNTSPTGLGALAQRVILCTLKVKAANNVLDNAKEELTAAQEAIATEFAANSVRSIKYKDFTVHMHDQHFGNLKSSDNPEGAKVDAMQALKDNGLAWMVTETVFAQTLHAWVREQPIDKETLQPKLPDPLVYHIKVTTKSVVGVKKS
jgi:hypothetical protein